VKVFTRNPAQRSLRSLKIGSYVNIIFLFLLTGFMVYLCGQNIYYETLRRDPADIQLAATATSTQHECSKGGCWYDSYGYYTINGTKEDNVQVLDHWPYPLTGPLSVLVNPKHPRFAMNPDTDPYPKDALLFAGLAVLVLGSGIVSTVIWHRAMNRYKAIKQSL
jgi:hypothetical protein